VVQLYTMDYIHAIILGLVQGLTEFLPISSSGHLIIARKIFNLPLEGSLSFDAVLQCATALAVLLYFAKDLWGIACSAFRYVRGKAIEEREKTYIWAIILGTIPAVIFGLLLESTMDSVFRNTSLVAGTLLAGSVLMGYAQEKSKVDSRQSGGGTQSLTLRKGIVVGFFQSLALIPGISRSGSTISGGLLMGLSREEATRFSFLLSVPILVGSGLKKLLGGRFYGFWGCFWAIIHGLSGLICGRVTINSLSY